jgi:SAM-dependent methyltransferase
MGARPIGIATSESPRSAQETARIQDLLDLIPVRGDSVLDVGARDGYLSGLLADRFDRAVALDLVRPEAADARVEAVVGDATKLDYGEHEFDTVVCAEVLEHIPEALLETACREIIRVARSSVVIGVPFRQDLRYGQTTCRSCRRANPPWGHLNVFDQRRLVSLFSDLALVRVSYVGAVRNRTNVVSAGLMRFAGNPYGTYAQDEPCIHCGARIDSPRERKLVEKIATKGAHWLERVQRVFVAPQAAWIHARFDKVNPPKPDRQP